MAQAPSRGFRISGLLRPSRLAVLLAGLALALGALPAAARGSHPTVVVGASGLVWYQDSLGDGRLYILLVNEGKAPVPASLGKARLIIDGKPLEGDVAGSLIAFPDKKVLAPGENLQWGAVLSAVLSSPGLHSIMIQGAGIRSNVATVLVLPGGKSAVVPGTAVMQSRAETR